MKKRRILIATHGNLAEGFNSALKIIASADEIETCCCYTEPSFNLDSKIEEIMTGYNPEEEELFVFTDLLGGSVNNGFFKALEDNKFYLITNTSLGLLLDFLITQPDIETLKNNIAMNEFNAVYCNDLLQEIVDIEEDL